ncbi:MAG TPA: ATP-grasp domain-containing protein [Thermoanaerobaculia bacterium]|nr:ATP-grasp domain-containing protein [Thermoanaerobaculia bacterium]
MPTLILTPRHTDDSQAEEYAGSPEEEDGLLRFVQSILADPAIDFPAAIVLDVGRIEGRGWAVVEPNGAWGAGLYGCDPREALWVIQAATRRDA